jgi:hypothetical protein
VVDRSSPRRLRAEISYGTGLEAILCFRVLNGVAPSDTFERGREFARAKTQGLPAGAAKASNRLRTPNGDVWSCLLALAAVEPPPHDLDAVVARFGAMSPPEFKSALVRSLTDPGRDDRAAEARPVERMTASDLQELVLNGLRDLPVQLYGGTANAQLLELNAGEAQRVLADNASIETVIERLTRGVLYKPEPGVGSVVLTPSLVHRPWNLVVDHGGRKLFCYPARLESELAAPDLGLIAIYRALGDGTRLRILRRLAAGPASVARMSDQLGLAKSTVHEHLESLRAAGLVHLRAPAGFELVPELPDLNWMLKEFLGLEMRGQCETCGAELEPDGVAYICSYECTFCDECASSHELTCPNCAGELVLRPRRKRKSRAARHRSGHRATVRGRSA